MKRERRKRAARRANRARLRAELRERGIEENALDTWLAASTIAAHVVGRLLDRRRETPASYRRFARADAVDIARWLCFVRKHNARLRKLIREHFGPRGRPTAA